MKSSEEIREAFHKFWEESPRNAKLVPNMSLVPNNNPTLLFVNSGMFPLIPYLSGQPHPLGTRLYNVQRCVRTIDIDDVGDNRHLTCFEMVGNWSLGDFTKAEQIPWILELHVERYGFDPSRLYISVWGGNEDIPRDDEAIELWKKAFRKYGIEAEYSDDTSNLPKDLEEGKTWKPRIFPFGKKENWWQPGPDAPGELGGPCSEIFFDTGKIVHEQEKYNINDDSWRFIEIGNNVFMEYKYSEDGKWEQMEKKNIDFGGGFERLVKCVQEEEDFFGTDLFMPYIQKAEELSGTSYKENGLDHEKSNSFRVIADHIRTSVLMIADGVVPSNKDQGYILRRLIRRMIRHAMNIGISDNFSEELAKVVIEKMKSGYPHLEEQKARIVSELVREEEKFSRTISNGLKELNKLVDDVNSSKRQSISGEDAFNLYETYGFPVELTTELLKEMGISEFSMDEFNQAQEKHQSDSRAGSEQKFKGGLADGSVETTKLHTAHHLLLAALQQLVDSNIKQRGSNITSERLRIDFNLDRKLTEEEVKQIEAWVNEKISQMLPVVRVEMKKEEAENIGAQMEFGAKYPDIVSIYYIGNSIEDSISKEFCGGPHVSNTSELGEGNKTFKILKEESSGSGIRRIKAGLV
jgi:alanyl-tRNA synthetase